MLTNALEKICYIIVKAREFDEKVEPDDEESGSNPSDDKSVDVLEDLADDPTYAELIGALRSLNEDEMVELLALTWVGRGDFSKSEWKAALAEARGRRDAKAPEYLAGTPQLGDFLEEGLAQLGYSCTDFEMGRL